MEEQKEKTAKKAGQCAGNNRELFKGLYYIQARNTKTGELTGWCTRIQLMKALGGNYSDMDSLSNKICSAYCKGYKTMRFHEKTYALSFKEDPKQAKEGASS